MKLRGLFALALALICAVPALAQVNPGTSPLSIPKGGTGGATAAAARTSLGLAIGSNVQAWNALLDCFSGLGTTGILRRTGPGTCSAGTAVALGSEVSGALPIANGGTSQTTAVAARSSFGLNVDQFTGRGDSNYVILATDRTVGTNAAFTASRTWTLPAANAVNPGGEIIVADYQGTVTVTNTLVVTRAGADTINGGTQVTITVANGAYLFRSDGASKWTAQALGAATGGGVSSVTCGTGLSGGVITTSGTCAVSLTSVPNSLGADVNLSNTASYFDGPSVPQGTSGTWDASGAVSLTDTAGAARFDCKLWDGTTVIASGVTTSPNVNQFVSMSLSGVLASPAANIRISCKDVTSTSGKILFNQTGNSKDSTLTVKRIQ